MVRSIAFSADGKLVSVGMVSGDFAVLQVPSFVSCHWYLRLDSHSIGASQLRHHLREAGPQPEHPGGEIQPKQSASRGGLQGRNC